MPEKGGNSYQNISLAMQESDRKNNIYCRGHLNVDVLNKSKKKIIIDILFYTAISFMFDALYLKKEENL